MKLAFLTVSKAIGLFALARLLTRKRLRILCYHGFSVAGEHEFREKLFMTTDVFRRRMQFLADAKFPVLGLEDGADRLAAGTLPPAATVITIDDGFASVHREARPVLVERGFPATLYLTTYYFEKQTPIYRLAVAYILWAAANGSVVDLSGLGVPGLEDAKRMTLSPAEKERVADLVRDYGETSCDEPGRQAIAEKLAEAVGVDYGKVCDSRMLSLVSEREAAELEQAGIGIELHTHRHNFPTAAPLATQELTENRESIGRALGKHGTHFCYPSGEWSREHLPVLEELGIKTATTCDPGLASAKSHPLALPRLLDDMQVSQIEFEAAMSGYTDLLRGLAGR